MEEGWEEGCFFVNTHQWEPERTPRQYQLWRQWCLNGSSKGSQHRTLSAFLLSHYCTAKPSLTGPPNELEVLENYSRARCPDFPENTEMNQNQIRPGRQ